MITNQPQIGMEMRSLGGRQVWPLEGGGLTPIPARPDGESVKAGGFMDYLRAQMKEVASLNVEAEQSAKDLVSGRSGDIHGTMIALEKAELSFRLLTKVRNKVVEAYQEVMRMHI